jgi:hypothetical protein
MPWSGAGLYSRVRSWIADQANGLHVQADLMDADANDMATAINNCLTKDGQNAAAAHLPMGGFRHTGVGAGAARDHYATVGQLQDGSVRYAVAGGAANALTLSLSPPVTSLVDGMEIAFKASATCAAGATTVAVNAVAAKSIKRPDGSDPLAGDIVNARAYSLRYVVAIDVFILLNPSILGNVALGTPISGALTNCTGLPINTGISGMGTGVAAFLATPSSANLAAAVTDETGSGAVVFGTGPTLNGAVGAVEAMTDGATITPSGTKNNYTVTLNGNRTLANPTTMTVGIGGVFRISQDGTGGRTLSFGAYYKFPGGSAPSLSTAASAVDLLPFYVASSTRVECGSLVKGVA